MRLALVFVLTTLVATCGQKGPLELPRAPAEARSESPNTAVDSMKGPNGVLVSAIVPVVPVVPVIGFESA